MKFFSLTIIFSLGAGHVNAQKYILLDEHISQPVHYSNTVTVTDKVKGFFPVEKKNIGQFIKALEEINHTLSARGHIAEAKQYRVGCVTFTGLSVSLAKEDRLDYVLTADCDNIKINMHLSDAKISNADNAFFISTWIKYIRNSVKTKDR